MRSVFIDDTGNYVDLTAAYAAEVLQLRLSPEHLARYAIVNLGWVELTRVNNCVTVRCRPGKLTMLTLVALFYAMADRTEQYIQLRTFSAEWSERVFATLDEFARFLGALCPSTGIDAPASNIRFLRQSVGSNDSCFAPLISRVHMIASNMSETSTAIRMLENLLPARWSIVTVDRENGASVISAMSGTFRQFNPNWHDSGQGAPITEFGDRSYGVWVADHHRRTQDKMTAAFDFVDATISFPELGDMRLRYECMTYPIMLPDRSRLLVCSAIDRTDIDLRKSFS